MASPGPEDSETPAVPSDGSGAGDTGDENGTGREKPESMSDTPADQSGADDADTQDVDPAADTAKRFNPEGAGSLAGDDQETASTSDSSSAEAPPTSEETPAEPFSDTPKAILRRTREINQITTKSRFEELNVRGERHRNRYADVYEVLVGKRGNQQAVALGLLHRPEDRGKQVDFENDIGQELEYWSDVDDHEGILTVHDWGLEPRPWLATELFENTLATRRRVSLNTAVRDGIVLADAVSHLHQRDVVHGAIDPKNVVYPTVSVAARQEFLPRLTHVSLIHTFKHYFSPGNCLDPRYAAPEYYNSQFGSIDHSTDIYHLGAVCYRLCTGRHPYRGGYKEIRHSILKEGPPRPSAVAENVPDDVDELVAKAMARPKLRRYETVEHFQTELRGIEREYSDG